MTLPPLFQQDLFNSKYKEEPTMSSNVRPATMERITTPALAEAFIAEQIKAIQDQVGDKKVLLALSGGVDSSVVAALTILVSMISRIQALSGAIISLRRET